MREIENALLANHKRLYHPGMEAVAKSTLSEAMNRRNPEIFKVTQKTELFCKKEKYVKKREKVCPGNEKAADDSACRLPVNMFY